jgi:hypothetical protein
MRDILRKLIKNQFDYRRFNKQWWEKNLYPRERPRDRRDYRRRNTL